MLCYAIQCRFVSLQGKINTGMLLISSQWIVIYWLFRATFVLKEGWAINVHMAVIGPLSKVFCQDRSSRAWIEVSQDLS